MSISCVSSSGPSKGSQIAPPKDRMQSLPSELIANCLKFLDVKDLGRSSTLNHKCVQAITRYNVRNSIVHPCVFGEEEWKKYIGDPGVVPALPKDWESQIWAMIPSLEGEKSLKNVMVIWMPSTLNGQPFKFKDLGELVQRPLTGNATKYVHIWDQIISQFGEMTGEGKWYVIGLAPVKGTRKKGFADQQALVTGYGHKVPSIFPLITAIFMKHISEGSFPYGSEPLTYSRTLEQINGVRLIVGGFAAPGLRVLSYFWDPERDGMGALREVPPSG